MYIQNIRGLSVSVTKQHIDSKLCQGFQLNKKVHFDKQLSQ